MPARITGGLDRSARLAFRAAAAFFVLLTATTFQPLSSAPDPSNMSADQRIPVTVLTGFLGLVAGSDYIARAWRRRGARTCAS